VENIEDVKSGNAAKALIEFLRINRIISKIQLYHEKLPGKIRKISHYDFNMPKLSSITIEEDSSSSYLSVEIKEELQGSMNPTPMKFPL
jgi:hypothetical protein